MLVSVDQYASISMADLKNRKHEIDSKVAFINRQKKAVYNLSKKSQQEKKTFSEFPFRIFSFLETCL